MTKIYIAVMKYNDENDKKIIRVMAHKLMDNLDILKSCVTELFDDEFYFHNNIVVTNNNSFFDKKKKSYFDFSVVS